MKNNNNNNFNNYSYHYYQAPRPQKSNKKRNNYNQKKNSQPKRNVHWTNNSNNKRILETNKKTAEKISNKKRVIEKPTPPPIQIVVPESVTKTIQLKNILFYIGQFLTSKDLFVCLLVNKRFLEVLQPVLQQKFQEIRLLTNTFILKADIDALRRYIYLEKDSLTTFCHINLNTYRSCFDYFLLEHEKDHPDCMKTIKPLFNNEITYEKDNFNLSNIKTLISHHNQILKFLIEKNTPFFNRLTIGYLNKFLNLLIITYKVEDHHDKVEQEHNKITNALYNFYHNIMTYLKDEKNLLSIIIKKHTIPFIQFLEKAYTEILTLKAPSPNKAKLTILMCFVFALKILHVDLKKSQKKLKVSKKKLNTEKEKLKKEQKKLNIDNPKLKTYNNNLAVYQKNKKQFEEKLDFLKKAIKPFDQTNCFDSFVKWAITGDTKSSSKGKTYTLPCTNTILFEEALEIIRLETLNTEPVEDTSEE